MSSLSFDKLYVGCVYSLLHISTSGCRQNLKNMFYFILGFYIIWLNIKTLKTMKQDLKLKRI